MGLWKLNRGHTEAGHQRGEDLLHGYHSEAIDLNGLRDNLRLLKDKIIFAIFLVRSTLLFDCFYGHCLLWPHRLAMYKEKVCSVGMILRLFWMAQLNYPFYSDLKTLTSMASEVVRGHLRLFIINSCLPFFKVLDYFLFVFMGIIGNWLLLGLRGRLWTRTRSALWVWFWDFFGWHNWITFFLDKDNLRYFSKKKYLDKDTSRYFSKRVSR